IWWREAAASRHQIERTLRETAERRDRFARQLAEVDRELSDIVARISGLPDPAEKRLLVEDALARLEESELGAIAAEQAVAEARAAESAARPPLQDATAELQRIETEARTLAKILNAASGALFPSVLEQISVERGYETALGAALGEDLDVPLDRSAPVHWGESAVKPGDAALPEGVRSLASVVRAPAQLARRLAQIGIVDAADGRRLQAQLAPGQRLVSRDGALWRWDGLTASADAPTAAAQRLAQKNRLAELDAEAVQATRVVREAEEALARAEQAMRQAS
ncbi:MAG: chromosome segregation protein SMC, partial [Mesorhizobium sp.]